MIDWLNELPVADFGGASFVEFTTGLNIATTSWPALQDKLRTLERQCKKIAADAFLEKEDGEYRAHNEVRTWFAKRVESWVIQPLERLNNAAWKFFYRLSILMVFVGIGMLYLNTYCPGDILLALPSIGFLLTTLLTSGLVRIAAFLIRRLLRIDDSEPPNPADFKMNGG
jgi:hypothetical protein